MAELIDRNELLKVLIHRVKGNEDNFIVLGTNNTLSLVEEWVRSIQNVDAVEVVHSQFRKSNEEIENYGHCYSCIECGATMMVEDTNFHDTAPNWCALCGAKMDGDGNA